MGLPLSKACKKKEEGNIKAPSVWNTWKDLVIPSLTALISSFFLHILFFFFITFYISCSCSQYYKDWLQRLITDTGIHVSQPNPLYCDSKSAINIAHNDIFHEQTSKIFFFFLKTRKSANISTVKKKKKKFQWYLSNWNFYPNVPPHINFFLKFYTITRLVKKQMRYWLSMKMKWQQLNILCV